MATRNFKILEVAHICIVHCINIIIGKCQAGGMILPLHLGCAASSPHSSFSLSVNWGILVPISKG